MNSRWSLKSPRRRGTDSLVITITNTVCYRKRYQNNMANTSVDTPDPLALVHTAHIFAKIRHHFRRLRTFRRLKFTEYFIKSQSSTIDAGVVRKTGRMSNVLHVNGAILMLPPYVLLHIRGLLGHEIAVRTLETRRLAALVSQVSHQAALLVVDTRTIPAWETRAPAIHVPAPETGTACVSHRPEGRTETWKQK